MLQVLSNPENFYLSLKLLFNFNQIFPKKRRYGLLPLLILRAYFLQVESRSSALTFANASNLGKSESGHSAALTNRSRKFTTVGTETSKLIVFRMRLSIFKT